MLSCAKITLLMFLWRIFSKDLRDLGRVSLLRDFIFGSYWPLFDFPRFIYFHVILQSEMR